jgi:Tol biopolymer transport system component
LVWVSRTGVATAVDPSWVEPFIGRTALSPDGKLVAAAVSDATGGLPTLWVKQLDRGPASPLGKIGASPPWQPRSRTILFATAAGRIALGPADGSVPPTEVGRWNISAGNPEFTPDGKSIVFARGGDIYLASIAGDSAVHAIVSGPANENAPTVSPDGRWLLYTSNESGRGEAYVRPFPDTKARRHKLSEGGARFLRWSRDGREVFFVDDRDELMVVAVRAGADFGFDAPRKLFEAGAYGALPFDVDTDGQRFLMSRAAGSVGGRLDDLIVVQGFFADLKARVTR